MVESATGAIERATDLTNSSTTAGAMLTDAEGGVSSTENMASSTETMVSSSAEIENSSPILVKTDPSKALVGSFMMRGGGPSSILLDGQVDYVVLNYKCPLWQCHFIIYIVRIGHC